MLRDYGRFGAVGCSRSGRRGSDQIKWPAGGSHSLIGRLQWRHELCQCDLSPDRGGGGDSSPGGALFSQAPPPAGVGAFDAALAKSHSGHAGEHAVPAASQQPAALASAFDSAGAAGGPGRPAALGQFGAGPARGGGDRPLGLDAGAGPARRADAIGQSQRRGRACDRQPRKRRRRRRGDGGVLRQPAQGGSGLYQRPRPPAPGAGRHRAHRSTQPAGPRA